MPFVLLLGGARSGKSSLAYEMATRSGAGVTVIATAEARDDEMAERIARHRRTRPASWTTIEEPLMLSIAVSRVPDGDFVVIDCLTLWVSNLLERGETRADTLAVALEAAGALAARPAGAVVVSNEVGMGIVPADALTREYRDLLGSVNSTFAEQAQRTGLMVAGQVLRLASKGDFMEGI
jgi:adenosyl cobinamide kinase/adenosyl cobinamide phosphate guanylyltransferase